MGFHAFERVRFAYFSICQFCRSDFFVAFFLCAQTENAFANKFLISAILLRARLFEFHISRIFQIE